MNPTPSAPPPFRNKRSIATVSLSGTLPDKLEAAATVGFDGVEIFENDLLTYDGSPAERAPHRRGPRPRRSASTSRSATSRRCRSRSAAATSTAPSASSTSWRRSAPTSCWSAATSSRAALDDAGRAAADLREMAERAARRGLRVGYEALAWGRHVNRDGATPGTSCSRPTIPPSA